jgi:stage V sporulation protein SpoVS
MIKEVGAVDAIGNGIINFPKFLSIMAIAMARYFLA